MTPLIRSRAWWNNKIPLSVMMFLLLVDGLPLTFKVTEGLFGLLCVICCVANYGYALNELYDIEEDARIGRSNVAAGSSTRWMWMVIASSAVPALGIAAVVGGRGGFWLTVAELCLPAAYSVPPLRIKERGWAGVIADALAAHVYPAAFALVIVSHLSVRETAAPLLACAILWSTAAGLRGILSHQLQSEDNDRRAGLSTVVHRLGAQPLIALVVFAILPVEILSFSLMLVAAGGTALMKCVAVLFVLYEWSKFQMNVFPVIVFNRQGQPYIPFVDEGFYKVWGPLALSFDAAMHDPLYLPLVPAFALLFRPRIAMERGQLAATWACFRERLGSAIGRHRHRISRRRA